MTTNTPSIWPQGTNTEAFGTYAPRPLSPLGLWEKDDWAIKTYGIQSKPLQSGDPILAPTLVAAAKDHVLDLLPKTQEEGEFYKTGFAVLHEGALANWLLFQWWTHGDVWCQLLSYADHETPEAFGLSSRPVRACVYETAVIWFEQKSWIKHVLNGAPDRQAYLDDFMPDDHC